jgi:type II secretory pathway pseudopilin PulG
MRHDESGEAGFTILEVAIASVISTVGLVFLATLFTLGIAQNRMVKQYTTATSLAQQKLEEINAVERTDTRLTVGGGLAKDDTDPKQTGYYDTVYVNPESGTVTNVIPQGATPIYDRYWKVENDPSFNNTRIISVRVAARQPTVGRKSEETTLTTVRSW